jgi:hypothetical protein
MPSAPPSHLAAGWDDYPPASRPARCQRSWPAGSRPPTAPLSPVLRPSRRPQSRIFQRPPDQVVGPIRRSRAFYGREHTILLWDSSSSSSAHPPAFFPGSPISRENRYHISRQYRAPWFHRSRKSDTLFSRFQPGPVKPGLLSTAYAKPLVLVVGEPMMVGPAVGRLSASGATPTDVLAGRHECS